MRSCSASRLHTNLPRTIYLTAMSPTSHQKLEAESALPPFLDAEKGEERVIEDVDEQKTSVEVKVDYSGFAEKTDPKEIRLVRKLDCYIMVGRAERMATVKLTPDHSLGNVLAELSGPQRYRACQK
jgi:hypothetical protein